MYLQLTGKGKTLEEALAALKERREAVVAQLEKLGVDKSALVFTPPGVDDSAGAQQRRMEVMIAQRMGGRERQEGREAGQAARSRDDHAHGAVAPGGRHHGETASGRRCRAREDQGRRPGRRQGGPETFAGRARGGGRNGRPDSPNMGGDEEQAKPGEPRFLFVARLSPQDRQTALADAFAKAKLQAAELAKAAGAGLGPMTGLSETAGGMSGYAQSIARYNNYNRSERIHATDRANSPVPTSSRARPWPPSPTVSGSISSSSAAFKVAPATPQQ